MKKLISILSIIICMFSVSACGSGEIEMTIKPFPEFEGTDFKGNTLNNEMFKEYDATVINFWTNSCGSCIAEMPELEEYYKEFKGKNINLVGVAASAGDSEELKSEAQRILKEKGVTYTNIIPDKDSSFYKDFIGDISGYPITYIVDSEGNMVGAPIIGVVKNQEEKLMKRLDELTK